MNKPQKDYWSLREEQFHEAISQWLNQTGKNSSPEDDAGTFSQLLYLAKHLCMTLKELKECLLHEVLLLFKIGIIV